MREWIERWPHVLVSDLDGAALARQGHPDRAFAARVAVCDWVREELLQDEDDAQRRVVLGTCRRPEGLGQGAHVGEAREPAPKRTFDQPVTAAGGRPRRAQGMMQGLVPGRGPGPSDGPKRSGRTRDADAIRDGRRSRDGLRGAAGG
jgi:hypothetical protein